MQEQTGIVFDISHYMLEDGPGIRTNVFLKGCYLHCKWCSNAYGLEQKIQLSYNPAKCVGCGSCLAVCESGAIRLDPERHKELTGKPLLNILPYHNFGAQKYSYLGKEYATEHLKVPEKEELDRIRVLMDASGVEYSVGGYDI